jgi:hypothetical protein
MARDDWRIRVELPEENAAHRFLERLGLGLGSEARDLARDLEGHRLAVSRDENELYVYAESQAQAEAARAVVEAELREHGLESHASKVEHWLHDGERWDDEPPGPSVEEELIAQGQAPWEVRVELGSREDAEALERRLESEGYDAARRFQYLIVGAETREEAEKLAKQLHGEVEPSSHLVWETLPRNPFVVFGGLGGSGTPL